MIDIHLRILEEADVTQPYVNWFDDEEVTKYSDNQYKSFSLEEQKSYVSEMKKKESIELYVPTVPEIAQTDISSFASFSLFKFLLNSEQKEASFNPKVIGSA